MKLTQDFVNTIRSELREEKELWNPQLIMDDTWEFRIPLDRGLSLKIFSHRCKEHYKLDSSIETTGDIEPEGSTVRDVLEETVEQTLPIGQLHSMGGVDGVSTCYTIMFDELEEESIQVDVYLPWGDNSIVVNVPKEIEDKAGYARETVEVLIRRNLGKAISEVSGERPRDLDGEISVDVP